MIEETHQLVPACLTRLSSVDVPGTRTNKSCTHIVGLSSSFLRIVSSSGLFRTSCESVARRRRTALSVSLDRVKNSTTRKQIIKNRRNMSVKDIERCSSNLHGRLENIRRQVDA